MHFVVFNAFFLSWQLIAFFTYIKDLLSFTFGLSCLQLSQSSGLSCSALALAHALTHALAVAVAVARSIGSVFAHALRHAVFAHALRHAVFAHAFRHSVFGHSIFRLRSDCNDPGTTLTSSLNSCTVSVTLPVSLAVSFAISLTFTLAVTLIVTHTVTVRLVRFQLPTIIYRKVTTRGSC